MPRKKKDEMEVDEDEQVNEVEANGEEDEEEEPEFEIEAILKHKDSINVPVRSAIPVYLYMTNRRICLGRTDLLGEVEGLRRRA
jgi:hypothetical protein